MSDSGATQARREIDAKAREWMSYLYSGEITEQGRAGFQAWLAESPDHQAAFQMLNDLWTSLDRVREIEDGSIEASRNSSNVTQPFERHVRSGWRRVLKIAANIGIAAGIAAMATFATLQLKDPVDERHLATAVGEIRTLGLIDGTQLVLRADTAIVASMSREERSVTIERGGAYFDVSKDETRPFVVSAGGIDVRVRGTAFDVLKGPSSVTVSVTHGRVAVSDLTDRNRSAVELTGGQQLTVEADGTFGAITEFDPKQVLGWRAGRFSYFNARLEDIVADINRYRTVRISIEDEALKDLRITTMFRVENAEQMLAGIEATEPVTIVRSPSSITIRRREDG
jgi:transmembrane sensor